MPSPLVYFQIATADIERSKAFYGELFGWDMADGSTGAIDPQGPGDFDAKGAFLKIEADAPPFVTPWFRVVDLAATLAKAEALGARVLVPVRRTPAGTDIALIRTPEGHSVGIVQA
jgi:uncharacterized protein